MTLAALPPPAARERNGRVASAAFVVGAATLVLGLWATPIAPDDREGDAASVGVAAAPLPQALPARAPVPAALPGALKAAPPEASRPGLIAAFETAHDLRAFVDGALRRPAEGGVFYALRAIAECRRWNETPPEPEFDIVVQRSHRELGQRRALADLANRRCAAFIDDDLADAEVGRLLALGTAQGDPLVLAYRGWLDAIAEGEFEAIVAALARVLHNADPALLDWVALTGADYFESGAGALTPLDETARRRRRDAWALLPCELGADCARPDIGTASRCLASGLCLDGQRDAIVLHGAWRSEGDRAALANEVAALRRAVQARNARAALGLTGVP